LRAELSAAMADEVCELWRLSGQSSGVRLVAFSTDGKWLATGNSDKTVELWNPATGECVRACTGHSNEVFSVAFSDDGKCMASEGNDKTVRVWDTASGKCVHTCTGHFGRVWAVAVSANGKWLASGSIGQHRQYSAAVESVDWRVLAHVFGPFQLRECAGVLAGRNAACVGQQGQNRAAVEPGGGHICARVRGTFRLGECGGV